jgi:hypothetical protein
MRANTKMNVSQKIQTMIRRAINEAAVGALCFGGIGAFFSGLSVLSGQLQLWDAAAIVTAMFLVGAAVCSVSCILRLVIEEVTSESPQEEELRRFLAYQPRITMVEPVPGRTNRVLYRALTRARRAPRTVEPLHSPPRRS